MSTIEVQIQERGRITIPHNIRKKRGLKVGDWITLTLVDEQPDAAPRDSRDNPSLEEVTKKAAVEVK